RWPEATRSAKGGSPTAGRNPPPSSTSRLLPLKCPGQTAPRASEERVEMRARLGADGTVCVKQPGCWGAPEHFRSLSDHSRGAPPGSLRNCCCVQTPVATERSE